MALNLKHVLMVLLASGIAQASPSFTARQLDGKDFADMRDMAFSQTKKCYKDQGRPVEEAAADGDADEIDSSGIRQTEELRVCLKEVVAFVLTRREQNDPVQRDLLKKTLLEIQDNYRIEVLKEIAKEAIAQYKRNGDNKEIQATAYEQIKNVLTEAKSRLGTEKDGAKSIIKLVHDSELDVDSKLKSFRANGPWGLTPNLSDKAEDILKSQQAI